MKRSEMLEKLAEMMVDHEEIKSFRAGAKYILECVEKAGMNPPEREIQNEVSAELNGITGTFKFTRKVFEWEPE